MSFLQSQVHREFRGLGGIKLPRGVSILSRSLLLKEKQRRQAGWSANEKGIQLLGHCITGWGPLLRNPDPFLGADPHGFPQENSHYKPCSGFSGRPDSLCPLQSTLALLGNHTLQAPATASLQDQGFNPASLELQTNFPEVCWTALPSQTLQTPLPLM